MWRYAGLLLLLLLAYVAAYLRHPALPNSDPEHPQGWWGWFDQSQYLRAAWALNLSNLDPQNFFYPPLYPVLGALLARLSPLHPFLVVDVICFLLFAFFFVDFARRYVGDIAAFVLLFISLVHPVDIIAVWVEPWTSTVVAPIFAYLFWQIDRLWAAGSAAGCGKLATMGLMGGLAFSTRPVDAVVMVPVFLFVAAKVLQHCRSRQNKFWLVQLAQHWAALVVPGLAGVAFFCGFNWIVHGSLGGSYFEVSTDNAGFHLHDLAEKAVAILLDPNPLYGSTAEAMLRRAPQLAIALPGVLCSLLWGPLILRLILLTVIWQFCIYLPYADLLPNGFWKYHNVHYFKWMLPYLWLCGFYPVYLYWHQRYDLQWIVKRYAVCALAATALLCVRFSLVDISDKTTITRVDESSPTSVIQWRAEKAVEVDMIALRTLQGEFNKIYFDKANSVSVDGRKLLPIRDFRFAPAPAGTPGINLLFIRPQSATNIDINPVSLELLPAPVEAIAYRYRFVLGRPAWLF